MVIERDIIIKIIFHFKPACMFQYMIFTKNNANKNVYIRTDIISISFGGACMHLFMFSNT